MNPLEAAKLAVKESDVLYSPTEYRAILANLIDWYTLPQTITICTPKNIPNEQLDYSHYEKL